VRLKIAELEGAVAAVEHLIEERRREWRRDIRR
jgi:hypothetical protein